MPKNPFRVLVNVCKCDHTCRYQKMDGIIWQSQVTIPYHQNIYKYYTLPLLAATNWPQTHHPSLVSLSRWVRSLESQGESGGDQNSDPFPRGAFCWKLQFAIRKGSFFGGPGNLVVAYFKVIISRFFWGPYFWNFGHVWILPITKQHHKFRYHRKISPKISRGICLMNFC